MEEGGRDPNSAIRAYSHAGLGKALLMFGKRAVDTERLEEAVGAFKTALKDYSLDDQGDEWAATQQDLADAFFALGRATSRTQYFTHAVDAYRATLGQCPRESMPLRWAYVQIQIGNALLQLGLNSDAEHVKGAVGAYQLAMEEKATRTERGLWSVAEFNLSLALYTLWKQGNDVAHLKHAVEALAAALQAGAADGEDTPNRGAKQHELGDWLATLGQLENSTERLEQAVAAYRAALEEHTREKVPLAWAQTQCNLGSTLLALGRREAGTRRMREARQVLRAALEEGTRDRAPFMWAMVQSLLGRVLLELGRREHNAELVEQAVEAFGEALRERNREEVALDWEQIDADLSLARWTVELEREATGHSGVE